MSAARSSEVANLKRLLQVEKSLDKIRDRMMRMKKTEELSKVIRIVFEEVLTLGFGAMACDLVILDKKSGGAQFWISGELDQDGEIIRFKIPALRHKHYQESLDAWKSRKALRYKHAKGKSGRAYLEEMLDKMIDSNMPQKVKKFLKSLDSVHHTEAYMRHGFLRVASEGPLEKKEQQILKKFTKVFEQTYTRFLDLKKAEEQARESQIEAALERVRARAMAMHSSDELEEVATVLREQMGFLGQPLLETVAIHIYENKGDSFNSWFAIRVPGKKGSIRSETTQFSKNNTSIARKMVKLFKSDQENYQITVQGKPLDEWHAMVFDKVPWIKKFWGKDIPKKQFWRFSDFLGGSLLLISREDPTAEAVELLKRSAKIFDLAYRRFLDLKKAEEQTREAQIEAALERVRTTSLAMHESKDLHKVVLSVFGQLSTLGVQSNSVLIHEYRQPIKDHFFWVASDADQKYPEMIHLPYSQNQLFERFDRAMRDSETFFSDEFTKRAKDKVWRHYFKHTDVPNSRQKFLFDCKGVTRSVALFDNTAISMFRYDLVSFNESENKLLVRFGQVFEQAYTRFLDLKKAEEQTREAQIEAALERVRARSMAMHQSEELLETSSLMFAELEKLGIQPFSTGFVLVEEDDSRQEVWLSGPDGTGYLEKFYLPLKGDTVLDVRYNDWKSKKPVFYERVSGKRLLNHLKYVSKFFGTQEAQKKPDEFPYSVFFYGGYFPHGYLHIITENGLSVSQEEILVRFTKVFEQTYTRFLDLKKAEEQAREAQVEAALERVRAASMAMHESGQLAEVIEVVFKQIRELHIDIDACLIHIPEEGDDNWHIWVGTGANNYPEKVMLPKIDHPALTRMEKARRLGERSYTQRLNKELKNQLIQFTAQMGILEKERVPMILEGEAFSIMAALDKHASLALYNYKGTTYKENDVVIAQRMLGVFEQAYTRFLDLKKAEEQAREALKQSSLDRIRGEIASMRTTRDLERITPLIWQELITLEVPFFRCGVFIIDDEAGKAYTYLSSPTGESLAVMALDIGSDALSGEVVKSWRKNLPHKEEWNKEQFADFTKSLIEQGHIQNPSQYQQGEVPPEKLVLQFTPFRQGMLYVGSHENLDENQVSLVQALANAFSVAYSRYEDFIQLEQAKKSVETTLGELRSTQSQLVHSEKMASLGELTAGIAHEIQNPLNFVNNFSEVNKELVEELKEAITQNDQNEINAILGDLLANEDKVMHHGKRAEQIVKSMLQHSRGSEGQKELTDINALCDEYMRLAYHGFRAKDQSFNADFRLALDPDLPKIEVVPQDIGRVLLNIINNAFQALSSEALAQKDANYKPTVTLSTLHTPPSRGEKGGVSITISDNGPGIPPDIREKIFQPFFTTKPTGQGTGLGLSMSYDIVTKGHGGTIEVDSTPGKTIFIMTIPIS